MTTVDAVRTLACGSWSMRVEGPAADLDWLLEFSRPWFTATASATRRVRLVRDDSLLHRAALADGVPFAIAAFELDQQTVRLEARSIDGSIVAADEAYGVVYVVAPDRSRIDVLAGRRNRGARTALMRVVREGVMIHARRTGHLLLHAAAVTDRTGCVVLAGKKNSGKTSLLLHLLHEVDTAFLSNDRVAINADEDSLVARGIPTVIGIGAAAQRLFLPLAEILRARESDHRRRSDEPSTAAPARCVVSPRQLCDALGVQAAATGNVRAIVFPTISPTASGIRLQRLHEGAAATRLEASCFGTAPFVASELFAPLETEIRGANATAILARLTHEVPCFDGILGPDAYRSEISLAGLMERAEAAT